MTPEPRIGEYSNVGGGTGAPPSGEHAPLHRQVERQLRKLGLRIDRPPTIDEWQRFLSRVSAAYADTDQQRYLVERSMRISSEEMSELHQRLRHQMHTDMLTGIANRRAVTTMLADRLASQHDGEKTALLFLDLDDFKLINDSFGHRAGDLVLNVVAERLRSALASHLTPGRLSGDEFVVVAPSTTLDEAKRVASELAEKVRAPMNVDGHVLSVSVSIGVAIAEGERCDIGDLLRRADIAMYDAKRSCRTAVFVAD